MSGGLATMAVGFGEYLGAYIPFFSTKNILFTLPAGPLQWAVNGGQLAGALAIALLSFINYIGLREGAGTQNLITAAKIVSLLGLAGFGFLVAAPVSPQLLAPLPAGGVMAAFGVCMIAVLWSFDGWYGATNLGAEMKNPDRNLPIGLIAGTAAVTLLYVLMNLVYVRALTVEEMAATSRIGETAARVLFGPIGARIITAAVLVSIFGCISSTILYCCRIYLPMAQDGVFFKSVAHVHPRYRTPSTSILAQWIWATVLTFSGSYEQLYTYVVFAVVLFHTLTGAAVFVLRRTRPEAPRPYKVLGFPWIPLIFILASAALTLNTLVEKPVESLLGVALLALGIPAYLCWRRKSQVKESLAQH